MFLHHLANRLIVFNEDRVFVFEGTYQDFLDKIGWESEVKKPKKEKPAVADKAGRGADISAYNKKLKFLHLSIAGTEKKIDDEEAALEKNDQKLIEIVKSGNSSEIRSAQIKGHNHQQALDALYKELEKLIEELDSLERSKPMSPDEVIT